MTRELIVVGSGGFGRETLDVVAAINAACPTYTVAGVLDDAPSEVNLSHLARQGLAYLGAIDAWVAGRTTSFEYAIAVGRPRARRQLLARMERTVGRPATLIHPDATVGSEVRIDEGAIICGGVQVSTNVNLGRHVHVNPNATIGHDAVLGDFVSINPAATISGACTIETGSLVGAGAVVLQGLTVGHDSIIGAAACVVRDVAAGSIVKGVPAR